MDELNRRRNKNNEKVQRGNNSGNPNAEEIQDNAIQAFFPTDLRDEEISSKLTNIDDKQINMDNEKVHEGKSIGNPDAEKIQDNATQAFFPTDLRDEEISSELTNVEDKQINMDNEKVHKEKSTGNPDAEKIQDNTTQASFPTDLRDEEISSELAAIDDNQIAMDDKDVRSGVQVNSAVGWIGLALSIMSFFMLPIILGGAGIVVGFVARSRDSEWLGNIAIAAGVISILVTLFIIPFF